MSAIQLQCISKRKQMISKFNTTIYSLQEEVKSLENQIQKYKQVESQKQQQFEEEIFFEKEKLNAIIEERQIEINRLAVYSKQMEQQLEETDRENEQLNNEIVKLGENFDETMEELKITERQRNQLKGQNQIMEQELQRIRIAEVKMKSNYEQKIQQLSDRFQYVTGQMKSSNGQVQKKYLQMTKSLLQRQQAQKHLTFQLYQTDQNLFLQKKKVQQSQKLLLQLERKYQKLQKSLLQHKVELNQQKNVIDRLNKQVQAQRAIISSMDALNKKLLEEGHEIDLKNEKLDFQLRQQTKKNQQNEREINTLRSKFNVNSDNLTKEAKTIQKVYSQLKSSHQILKFQAQRLQKTNSEQDDLIKGLKQANEQKKKEIKVKQDGIFDLENSQKRLKNQIQSLKSEVSAHQQQIFALKQALQQSQEVAGKYLGQAQKTKNLFQQIEHLRQQMWIKQQHFAQTSLSLQYSVVETKKQLSNRSTKQEEQRKKIRELESIVEIKQLEIVQGRNRIHSEGQKQKRLLQDQINQFKNEINAKKQEHQFEKDHLQADLQEKTTELQQLHQHITQNQHLIAQQQKQLRRRQKKIVEVQSNLKQSLSQWDKQKSTYHPTDQKIRAIKSQINRFEKFSKEVDLQSRQLIEISKRKSNLKSIDGETPKGISEILRQISLICMRTKTKLLGRCQNDKDKQIIIADYRLLHEKIEIAMKSNGVMKPLGFH